MNDGICRRLLENEKLFQLCFSPCCDGRTGVDPLLTNGKSALSVLSGMEVMLLVELFLLIETH